MQSTHLQVEIHNIPDIIKLFLSQKKLNNSFEICLYLQREFFGSTYLIARVLKPLTTLSSDLSLRIQQTKQWALKCSINIQFCAAFTYRVKLGPESSLKMSFFDTNFLSDLSQNTLIALHLFGFEGLYLVSFEL